MNRILWTIFLVNLTGSGLYGQNFSVCGAVENETTQPLGYVTVQLMGADSSVQGAITDSLGMFCIEAPSGLYTLKVETWGYVPIQKEISVQNNMTLSDITLVPHDSIGTVHITTRRPLVVRELDRMKINVENSMLADGDMWEMLRLAPGILADASGNLMMYGKSGIRVMVDGRPINLTGEDLQSFLSGLSAQDVASVELITSPPASMGAEGSGVINIVMKKLRKDSYSVNLHQQFKRGVFNKYKSGGSVLAKYKKWYFNFSYSFDHRKDQLKESNSIRFSGDSISGSDWLESNSRISQLQSHTYSLFAEREIKPDASISFRSAGKLVPDYQANTLSGTTIINTAPAQDSSITNQIGAGGINQYIDGFVGYKQKWGNAELSTGVDYAWYHKTRDQFVDSEFFNESGDLLRSSSFEQATEQDVHILGARIDMSHALQRGGSFSYGIGGSSVFTENITNHNQLIAGEWLQDSLLSNRFQYREQNASAYTSLTGKWNNWKYKLGLRAEYTQLNGDAQDQEDIIDLDYLRFFPVLNAQNELKENHSIGLSYSQRINRPDYSFLNSFRVYSSPYSYFEGNPFLLPSITRRVEANWLWKYTYYLAAFAELISDPIEEISVQNNATREISYSAINLNSSFRTGLTTNGSAELNSWWSVYWDVTGYYQRFEFAAPFTGEAVQNNGIFVNPFIWNGYRIEALGDLSVEWEFNYVSPVYQGAFLVQRRSEFSIGLRKKFLQDRLRVSLFVADLFDQNKFTLETNYTGQSHIFREDPENQYVRLGLVWNLGGQKVKKKSAEKINTGEKQRL